jgi:hypothetical protein
MSVEVALVDQPQDALEQFFRHGDLGMWETA